MPKIRSFSKNFAFTSRLTSFAFTIRIFSKSQFRVRQTSVPVQAVVNLSRSGHQSWPDRYSIDAAIASLLRQASAAFLERHLSAVVASRVTTTVSFM